MARARANLLDIDAFVAMVGERFGPRFGGSWRVETGRSAGLHVGVVGLDEHDRAWVAEQTPPRPRPIVHVVAVRHPVAALEDHDEVVFHHLAALEQQGRIRSGWSCAIDIVENRVVVVLAGPDGVERIDLPATVPASAVTVTTSTEAGPRIRRLVAPLHHDRSVGARALGAAMTVVGEIVHGRSADTETEIVADAPDDDPPLDLDFGGLDPLE